MRWWEKFLRGVGLGEANLHLLVLGVGMIVLGVVLPGSQSGAVSLLIILGAGIAVAGALAGPYSQMEIGPHGIKVSRDGETPMPVPWLAAEAETLSQVAQLVLGNQVLAREVVEDAITRVGRHRREIPRNRLDLATFKTLVALLERAENKLWFSGSQDGEASDGVRGAVRALPFTKRIAFALSLEFPPSEVADILDRPERDVSAEVEAVRVELAPHLSTAERRAP